MHSSNFLSKSWNSKYLLVNPSVNPEAENKTNTLKNIVKYNKAARKIIKNKIKVLKKLILVKT